MRVISGSARGAKLYSLEGNTTRPTLDRVKEALFNIIQNEIKDSEVLDLFSGSGALAIEALSRGAKFAILCDQSQEAINMIRKNLEKTHLKEKANVIKDDYQKALNLFQNKYQFDLIFIDPPYAGGMVKIAIDKIMKLDLLKENGQIIIETDEEERILKEIKETDINVYDLRKYGRVKLIFLNRKG